MAFKRRKMLELQTFFLQIWVIIGKLKSDVSGSLNANQLEFTNSKPLHTLSAMVTSQAYKCLWSVGGKDRDSSLQKGASYTYTLRLS